MLKTNSKQARETLRKYIIENSADYLTERAEYDGKTINTESFPAVASAIYECFITEYRPECESRRRIPENVSFCNYAQGLPCGGLFTYYLHSAVSDLGNILDETEAERSRFSETEAENMLTSLIYGEIKKAL